MKRNLKCAAVMPLLVLALAPSFVIGAETSDFNVRLKAFSADRHTLANRLATELDIPTPEGMKPFFEAAEEGDWLSVSNRFKAFLKTDEPMDGVRLDIHNELWSPVLETLGIYEVVEGWKRDSSLLAMFHEPIMTSIPTNSIYLGGTDYGRFVITTVNEDVMKEYVEPRSIYSLENAKKYLVALGNKRPLVPAEKTLLKKRIKELGADDSRIRAAAHKELRAFGVRATPLLMTYVNSEDPEVRLSVNTLVQQIRDAAEQFPAGDRRKAPPEE
jgi:hypothetical protein